MIAQSDTKALVTVIPDEQHTTYIEPFSDRELAALDTVMHVQDTAHHNLILQHASPGIASRPNTDHELHEVFYLMNHDILFEVVTGWYSFTALGIARAHVTAYAS